MALAMVGEALISASVEVVLKRIASREFRDFFSSKKLNVAVLDELKTKLLALNAVLNDAEEKQISNLTVKEWLDELKDVVLDAEDLLDEIITYALRCKVEGESKRFTNRVRSLLSSCFKRIYSSMNFKLETISQRLEHFVRQKDILGLQSVTRRVTCKTVTDSLVESVVVAREDDKETLLNMLLCDNNDGDAKSNVTKVITILGMGGLGKTTLAQSIYNDSEVQKHFDLTAWVWVSDDFDVLKITKKIVESFSLKDCHITNLDVLRVELKNCLRDKKFLLVLDDLWNEKYNDWHHLIAPFSSGKRGSKIIVTTRQQKVAHVTHTLPIYELKPLTDENCWRILARHAFGDEGYDKYPSLEEIGRKIARKCNGLPLAAKTLGGLLRSNDDAGKWNRILNSNLWAHDDVLPALQISYFHLPAHLKRCFAYCSIFPKQYLLDRKELILLWMAEGFLQQIDGEQAMESAGLYLEEFLAALKAGKRGKSQKRDTKLPEMPAQVCRLQDLRTLTVFIVGRQLRADLKSKYEIEELMLEWGSDPHDPQIGKDVLNNLQPSTNLKKLNIKCYGGTSFPNWIGDSSFSNITVIGISDCNHCLSLPPFGQLPSLKELVIKRMKMVKTVGYEFYCSDAGSPSFQPFPSLESLKFEDMLEWQEWLPFEGEGNNFPFHFLKCLCLYKCPKLRGNLPNCLPSLTEVSLSECNLLVTKSSDMHWNTSIEIIHIREGQEGLLSSLENFSYCKLFIETCDSLPSLPRMILSANCLQELTITNIPSLIFFPADGLPTSLRSLDIWNCRKLEFLSHDTWHKFTSLEQLRIWNSCYSLTSFSLGCFPALQELNIRFIPNLEVITTQAGGEAPILVDFIVTDCKKLRSLPDEIDLPALEHLDLSGLPELASLSPGCFPSHLRSLFVDVGILSSISEEQLGLLFQRFTSLSHLLVKGLGDEDLINTLLKEQLLPTTLEILFLHNVDGLKLLEGKGFQNLTSLQQLHMYNCRSFECLPEDQLPSSLAILCIRECPLLEARYRSQNGRYWSKIAHIPAIQINEKVII
ncbi:putative disease resistance RPP13-like protein 1 isoform X6 [Cajanus cajan]|uniref:putative disease resistance RPP13-like protein 1 isoform X6 n=1 Tax=Cajanus cajan TaxID=3821 RepID=UPI0010FB6FB7|nr:putative disease resistance RPP13-like protein 1 isoform X6 [Cajanus cajan]